MHPAPLWAARLLVGMIMVVIVLVYFGRLDIVAVAPGQLIPTANVKIVQPAVTGVVRRILVQNGERVEAGQLLVELDPTQATADANKAKTNEIDAQLTMAGARALLRAQAKGAEPVLPPVLGANPERQAETQSFAEGVYNEYIHKLKSLKWELEKRRAELESTHEEVVKLQQTAPLARQVAHDDKALAEKGYVSSHDYLDKQSAAIDQTQELAAQVVHARELEAGIQEQQHDIDATIATFRREQWDALNQSAEEAERDKDERTKASARQDLMQLKAPVAGLIQQLSVHTVGGVVTSAQALLEIVPDDALEVEAHVSNKDIGFVTAGQDAIIKIATFPYTRYGYLTGRVVKVSNDATQDKKLGAIFLARLKISNNRFRVENKWINLTPGMEVTAEIKTGKRKVWEYFLGPLLQASRESLRER